MTMQLRRDVQFTEGEGLNDSLWNSDGLMAVLASAELSLADVLAAPLRIQDTEDEAQVLRLAALPNEGWRETTDRLIEENARRLSLVTAFATEPVSNPSTTTEKRIPRISRGEQVEMGADPTADGSPEHVLDYSDQFVSLPWYWRRYRFPIGLADSDPAYVTSVMADGVGALANKLESIAKTGAGKFAGRDVEGLDQLPAANKVSAVGNKDWGLAATTGSEYTANIKAALRKLAADGFATTGVGLFVNPVAVVELIGDYSDTDKDSIRSRIDQVVGSIQESDTLGTDEAVYLPPGGSMVWCEAYMPRAITWTDPSGLSQVVLCVAKGAPGIRKTYDDKIGAILQS